jgi:hypothetical protein
VSEKNATSAPEIKKETVNNTTLKKIKTAEAAGLIFNNQAVWVMYCEKGFRNASKVGVFSEKNAVWPIGLGG